MPSRQVKQFVVGDKSTGADFSKEEIEALIYKLALWFKSDECDRAYDDPVASARQKVQECLLATTEDGSPWKMAPHEFAKRIKAKCSYDITTDTGISSPRVKRGEGRKLSKEAKEGAASLKDGNAVMAAFDQNAFRGKVEADILLAFPELDNPAHRPNVESLSGMYAQRKVIDLELAAGVTANKREVLLKSMKMIEEMADTTMRRLGVHPDQIRRRISDRTASSVADLVAQIEDDDEWRKREKVWALQLALQLWWMSEHPNGRKTGPNLADFEIWHMTRNRPVNFTCRCGVTTPVVEGFEPKDLWAWLVKEGVLVEEPVLPFIKRDELTGLNDYFSQDGTYGGTDSRGTAPGGVEADSGVPGGGAAGGDGGH